MGMGQTQQWGHRIMGMGKHNNGTWNHGYGTNTTMGTWNHGYGTNITMRAWSHGYGIGITVCHMHSLSILKACHYTTFRFQNPRCTTFGTIAPESTKPVQKCGFALVVVSKNKQSHGEILTSTGKQKPA